MWNSKEKVYCMHTLKKLTCIKVEQDVDGEGKGYSQWCMAIIGILGKGNGNFMLLGKFITYISIGWQKSPRYMDW